MSRGIIEAQTLRSEQFQFEARTSDPADAQPGEYWIRVDQTGTNPNVIAQLRRQDTSGVTACPIFAASEESNLGADVVRGPSVVLNDGSVGFVAMTTGAGAVGSPRAVNSAGTEYLSHNGLELNPIRDTYESQDYSGSSNGTIEEEFGFTYEGATYGEIDWENSGAGRNTAVYLKLRVDGSFVEVGSVSLSNESSATGTETFDFSAVDADAGRAIINDNKINPTQFRVATDSSAFN